MGKCGRARLGLVFALVVAAATTASAECSLDTVSVRGDFGTAQFTVVVADDNAERGQGLMFVEQMATMEGMLFVYDRPQRVSFWMRNTLIPLDMVFVDDTGIVQKIHPMAVPLDETPIFGGTDIQYVLEINGGLAARLGLEAGDEMQHAAFGDTSVWPCP
ncbi:DUF192 domain-containing protein [Octadecabacter sp. G9-8]|uniref:DUF192 domain-containing protein n=1 Tax=Octadecabacter dasysiphoniae TaxID=2909341 RepID=A0ABS9CZX7_9RHOB|nr:DUF192 domain-containing protein [Octadecabacter dasysiphoniae]MCF2872826.1 DUF192 domain-containing protein [Octadecabacter dasysiphoniae]